MQDERHRLDICFTGAGGEYMRIWIVNLLLVIVTAGLYYPWAKARRLRYFHQNTLIGNDLLGHHAMDFHGDPKLMLRGFLISAALALVYVVGSQVSPLLGLATLVLIAALAPALLQRAWAFRLANTSWRGLRFRFTGTVGQAYRTLLPGALIVVGILLIWARPAGPGLPGTAWLVKAASLIGMIALAASVPLLTHRIKAYQHSHFAYGQAQTGFDASVGSFYALNFKVSALVVLTTLIAGLFASLLVYVGGGIGALAMYPIMLLAWLFVQSWWTASLQNLVWSHTRSDQTVFECALAPTALAWLRLKNAVLLVVTLGLYWPYAVIAMRRMRLEAVSLTTALHPDAIAGVPVGAHGGAIGESATELFGLDIGI